MYHSSTKMSFFRDINLDSRIKRIYVSITEMRTVALNITGWSMHI